MKFINFYQNIYAFLVGTVFNIFQYISVIYHSLQHLHVCLITDLFYLFIFLIECEVLRWGDFQWLFSRRRMRVIILRRCQSHWTFHEYCHIHIRKQRCLSVKLFGCNLFVLYLSVLPCLFFKNVCLSWIHKTLIDVQKTFCLYKDTFR